MRTGRLVEKASVEPERRHSEAAAAAQMAEMDGAKRMENRSVGRLVYCYLIILVARGSGGHGRMVDDQVTDDESDAGSWK
jgi:hypothetical protein